MGGHPDVEPPHGGGGDERGDQQEAEGDDTPAPAAARLGPTGPLGAPRLRGIAIAVGNEPGEGGRRLGLGQVVVGIGDDADAVHHRPGWRVHDVGLGIRADHHRRVAVSHDVAVVHDGAGQHQRLGTVEVLGRRHERAGELGGVGSVGGPVGARRGERRTQRSERLGHLDRLIDPSHERADGRVGRERHRPGRRLDHHQRQRVHVAATVEGLATRLLGRGVARRAQDRALRLGPGRLGQGPGQTEVRDAQPCVLTEEQVGRLDVAMDEATAVGVVESAARFEPDDEGLGRGQDPALIEHRAEAPAPEVLGHQVGHVVLAPVIHRHHVGVIHGRGGLSLGPEASQEGLVVGQGGVEDLDGDPTTQRHVVGQVHRRRRAGPDRGQQAVARREHQTDAVGQPGQRHPHRLVVTAVWFRTPSRRRRPIRSPARSVAPRPGTAANARRAAQPVAGPAQ